MKKYEVVEKSLVVNEDDVRVLCIRKNWYTCGNNADYENMFKMCHNANTDEDVYKIAEDILNHSNVKKISEKYGISEKGLFEHIIFELFANCISTLVKVEEA